ncbi:MAG: RdgB/HAM1 family non-canonical purine NTP pyrophosphatase [Lactobacillaceae bacterium]|jgi:XTP/dITP diphosphohydrolase|nr:RdgB/HAM1 family non-canonical purine NTP pyrophosphatase [Lactobacillaceae bacterium]
MRLIIATNNAGKLAEYKKLLTMFEVVGLKDLNLNIDIDETGETFHENVQLKINGIYKFFVKDFVLADDSGLVVNALNGEPGIFSARYAGNHDDLANIKKVLDKLKNSNDRSAYFHNEIILRSPNGFEITAIGETFGKILEQPVGKNGHGYDPIFYSDDLKKSFGMASMGEKNLVSHRGRAVKQLLEEIKENEKLLF